MSLQSLLHSWLTGTPIEAPSSFPPTHHTDFDEVSDIAASVIPEVELRFRPTVEGMPDLSIRCKHDLNLCNLECRRMYKADAAGFMKPCLDAVAEYFGEAGMAFGAAKKFVGV